MKGENTFNFNQEDYNTSFTYKLSGEYEKNIARTGIEDLKNMVNEILLFSEKIKEISVVIDTSEEKKSISYKPLESENLSLDKNIYEKKFLWKKSGDKEEVYRILCISEDTLTLALLIDDKNNIMKIDENKSRIFIDFPLVGSENFPFPVIINDRKIYPNEPRSGITLVDSEKSDEAIANKSIMKKCVSLYQSLFQYLIDEKYGQIWNAIEIPQWVDNPEMSEQWVRENVYNELYRVFSGAKIIDTDNGMTSLNNGNLRFVDGDTVFEKEDVYWLVSNQNKYDTAKYEVDWLEILKAYFSPGIQLIAIGFPSILNNIQSIVRNIPDTEKAFEWLNRLYKSCMKIEKYAAEIKSGNVPIYPSQFPGSFSIYRRLRYRYQMKEDKSTDTLLREVAEYFFGFKEMVDYRESIVDRTFELEEQDLTGFGDADIAGYINNYVCYIVNNDKIDNLKEKCQIGCAKLAEWIDINLEQHADLVKSYFPNFCSEEGRAKLLTSKAVAAISRNLREANAEIQKLKAELEKQKNAQCKIQNDLCAGDVCFSEKDLEDFGGDQEEFSKMVGNAGEEYAFMMLTRLCHGENDENISGLYEFDLDEKLRYEVIRPDTETYKQSGYDIIVQGLDQEGTVVSKDYFEVKTHTTQSIEKNVLGFSEEQMKQAIRSGKNYHALKVSYSVKNGKCVGMELYGNVISKILGGEFKHDVKGYRYYI